MEVQPPYFDGGTMQKPAFIDGYVYHVLNRGVDKRNVYLDDKDYLRFVHQLIELNDEERVLNVKYYFDPKTKTVASRPAIKDKKPRKRLVDILIFTLMPNHFHLLLRQKMENGIIKFMQKLGTGYTMYFNKKYDRAGSLFQGRFKAVMINRNNHFLYLPHYMHTNPLSLKYGGSTSIYWGEQFQFLKGYRWSSFSDYIGIRNFPSVTQRDYLLDIFGGEKTYEQHIISCLKEQSQESLLNGLQDMRLE
jgi:putative transposase